MVYTNKHVMIKDNMSLASQLLVYFFKAKHLLSEENILCDLLPLSKIQQFLQLAHWADKPVMIPSLPPYPS